MRLRRDEGGERETEREEERETVARETGRLAQHLRRKDWEELRVEHEGRER